MRNSTSNLQTHENNIVDEQSIKLNPQILVINHVEGKLVNLMTVNFSHYTICMYIHSYE